MTDGEECQEGNSEIFSYELPSPPKHILASGIGGLQFLEGIGYPIPAGKPNALFIEEPSGICSHIIKIGLDFQCGG